MLRKIAGAPDVYVAPDLTVEIRHAKIDRLDDEIERIQKIG